MSKFTIPPLSLTIDRSGDEPQVIINGTNYARNIKHGSVVVSSAPEPTRAPSPQTQVTVTFIVDDLRVLSENAQPEPENVAGGTIGGSITVSVPPGDVDHIRSMKRKGI